MKTPRPFENAEVEFDFAVILPALFDRELDTSAHGTIGVHDSQSLTCLLLIDS